MTNTLNALQQVVSDGPKYWCHENLIDAYCTNMLVPKIKDAFSAILPEIEALHKFACKDDNEHITCVHYTGMAKLFRMLGDSINLENAFFRLYDSIHLNDPNEGNYLLHKLCNTSHEAITVIRHVCPPTTWGVLSIEKLHILCPL